MAVTIHNGGTVKVEVVIKNQVETNPPAGKYRVTNLYVDPVTGRLEVEYDDTPVEEE